MTKHSCSVWMLAFVAAVPATLAAGERQRNRAGEPVIVIVNDNAGTPRCVLREMRTTMDHLLSTSGISMEWVYRDAKEAGIQPNPAPDHAGIPQVLLSIVPDKPAYFSKNHPSLGLTVMGTNHTALHLAEIRKLAERLRLELGQLMALVAVHEIGHWLLGRDHSSSGIMLEDWGGQEFRVMLPHRIPFSAAQVKRIREELEGRRAGRPMSQVRPGVGAATVAGWPARLETRR